MNANIRTIGGSIGAALMASIVTADAAPSGLPRESGYTNGFTMLVVAAALACGAAILIPKGRKHRPVVGEPQHAELGLVAAGTVVGDKSE